MPRKSVIDFSKLTAKEQFDIRVDFVGSLLARAYRNSEIREQFREKFGVYCSRTIDRYVSRAKRKALMATKMPKEDWIASSLSTYRQVIRNAETAPADVIKAQARIDTLLGLDEPKKVEMAGPGGGPIQIDQMIQSAGITLDDINGFIADLARNENPPLNSQRDGVIGAEEHIETTA